jgi:hypothetical protein
VSAPVLLGSLAFLNAATAAVNATLYAAYGDPISLGAAVFAGLLSLILAGLAVLR